MTFPPYYNRWMLLLQCKLLMSPFESLFFGCRHLVFLIICMRGGSLFLANTSKNGQQATSIDNWVAIKQTDKIHEIHSTELEQKRLGQAFSKV